MAKVKLCPGSRYWHRDDNAKENQLVHHDFADYGQRGMRPSNVKRIRIKCPRCGRRMMSSVSTCHDGCCIRHYLPPHKPKGWWKKRKRKGK